MSVSGNAVGQTVSTLATATNNAAGLQSSTQGHWYAVWTNTAGGLWDHVGNMDAEYLATHAFPAAGFIDSRIRMFQSIARLDRFPTSFGELKDRVTGLGTGMKQQAGELADQAAAFWSGT